MATYFETSQGFVNVKGFRINVTARLDTENRDAMKELVESTIKAWLYTADLITRGERKTVIEHSPETKLAARHNDIVTPLSEPRATVWGDMPSGSGFTLHSHSYIQDVLDIYWARHDAIETIVSAQATPQPAQPQNPANANVGANPAISAPAVEGVINATRAPNPKAVEYAADQLVAWSVNKIAMGANKGSATYALWGPLGQKYPLMTIYKCKPNSDENSPNYIAVKDFIVGLGLSVDAGKVEATGNWTLVCKAAHVPDKDGNIREYLNVVSLSPVQHQAAA